MSGGEIKHNASQNGGAVFVESGSFSMSGGSLYGNSATNGGSVWSAGSFNISGSASILSNPSYPQSVYLAKSAAINVDSGWTCPEVSGYTSAIQIDSEVKNFGTVIVKFSSGIVHKEKFVLVPAMSSQLALIAKDNTLVLAGADEAYICYTEFVSMLSQQPRTFSVLPLKDLEQTDGGEEGRAARGQILYEPSSDEVFDAIVPEYVAGVIYGGVCDSLASELAARRTAMEAATSNAEEMIEKLNLHYNRVRQASITQEITEIVAGAESI